MPDVAVVVVIPELAKSKGFTNTLLCFLLYLIVTVVEIPGSTSRNTVSPWLNPWVAEVETVTTFFSKSPVTTSLYTVLKLW